MLPGDDTHFLAYDAEITELSVLLPGEQAQGLERAAHERGLTTAQMLRRLIQDFLRRGQCPGEGFEFNIVQRWA
jgi:hypothetical protein